MKIKKEISLDTLIISVVIIIASVIVYEGLFRLAGELGVVLVHMPK